MSTEVHKVTSVSVDGALHGGVTSLALELSNNTIPVCYVGICPEAEVGNGGTTVSALDLKSLQESYGEFNNSAEGYASASVSISLDDGSGFELNDWLLIGAGLSRITTTSPFSLTCVLAHPAYQLTRGSACTYVGSGYVDFDKYADISDPVVSASQQAITAVQDANKDAVFKALGGGKDASDVIAERLGTLYKNIEKYISWEGGGLPGDPVLSPNGKKGRNLAVVQTWFNALNTSSFWEALVGVACPEFMLEVLPSYAEEMLTVRPARAWEEVKLTLAAKFIQSITFPGGDPDPIYGYIMPNTSGIVNTGGGIVLKANAQEGTEIQNAQFSYVPDGSSATGRIGRARMPGWYSIMTHKAASCKTILDMTTAEDNYADWGDVNGLNVPEETGSGENEDAGTFAEMALVHMQSMYNLEYRRRVAASVTSVFNPDTRLYPGVRAGFSLDDDTMFSGKVSTVRHIIDCAQSMASTVIGLNYCWSGDGLPDNKELQKAPYYE